MPNYRLLMKLISYNNQSKMIYFNRFILANDTLDINALIRVAPSWGGEGCVFIKYKILIYIYIYKRKNHFVKMGLQIMIFDAAHKRRIQGKWTLTKIFN